MTRLAKLERRMIAWLVAQWKEHRMDGHEKRKAHVNAMREAGLLDERWDLPTPTRINA